jgi:hypothetical protein
MALKSLKAPKVVTPAKKAPEPPPVAPALKKVTILLTPRQWRQLKEFVLDENTSMQGLIVASLAETMARKGITLDET